MQRGGMRRTAALPRGKSCSAYTTNAIASTWKKNFFADLFQVTKTVERDRWTCSDFFLQLADTILKPLTHHMLRGFFWWNRQFADRIFRPRSIERHAAAKPTQRPHILVAWRNFCRTLLLGIVWMYLKKLISYFYVLYSQVYISVPVGPFFFLIILFFCFSYTFAFFRFCFFPNCSRFYFCKISFKYFPQGI